MRPSISLPTLEELKIRARILLKSLRGDDPSRALAAAQRLQRLPRWNDFPAPQIIASREQIQLKHALAVIALENEYPSWEALRKALEATKGPPRSPLEETGDRLYPQNCGGTLNQWFTSYDEARARLDESGGFLFPYRSQFFICEVGHIENLGFAAEDPDWERIGRDWVKPNDLDAWTRLSAKLG
jgi:hypothetical protein